MAIQSAKEAMAVATWIQQLRSNASSFFRFGMLASGRANIAKARKLEREVRKYATVAEAECKAALSSSAKTHIGNMGRGHHA